MRRISKLSLVCLAAGFAGACKTADLVIPTEVLPYAGVRFINAVPDSAGAFGLDFRFVDILESNAHFHMTFRNTPSTTAPFTSTQTEYKGAREGTRHFRIFLDDTLQAIASTVVLDTSVAIVAGHNYTAIEWGAGRSAGTDKMRFNFWEEAVPDPVALVAMRVINATNAAIDVRVYLQGSTAAATPVTWANVAPFSVSTYVTMPAGTPATTFPAPGTNAITYVYNVVPAGSAVTATLFTDAVTIPGAPTNCDGFYPCPTGGNADIVSSPGTTVGGSAITGVVFPRSTAGSRAPQAAAFGAPVITFMWDRRPPQGCLPKYC